MYALELGKIPNFSLYKLLHLGKIRTLLLYKAVGLRKVPSSPFMGRIYSYDDFYSLRRRRKVPSLREQ